MSKKQYIRQQKILAVILILVGIISAVVTKDCTALLMIVFMSLGVLTEKN